VRNERNLGAYGNHNRCLEIANGEWVKFLHGDDELLPECLDRFDAAATHSPKDTGLLACGAIYIGPDGNRTRTFVPQDLYVMRAATPEEFVLEGNFIGTPTMVMIHRRRLLEIGGFDLGMEPAADGDCWINLRVHYPSSFLPEHLVVIRDDPQDSVDKRAKHLVRNCKDTFRQAKKWFRQDLHSSPRPLPETVYADWLILETFRFWDMSFVYLLRGRKEVLDALRGELRRHGLLGRSLKFYLLNRLSGRNSSNLRHRSWPESLQHIRIPAVG
jgi:glycosyltransferase involved in cell wall biosynthesis